MSLLKKGAVVDVVAAGILSIVLFVLIGEAVIRKEIVPAVAAIALGVYLSGLMQAVSTVAVHS